MTRQIRIDQIPDVMEEAVIDLVAATTLNGLEELRRLHQLILVDYGTHGRQKSNLLVEQ